MSFLKKIFNKEQPQRKLDKVADLRTKDIVVLNDSFAFPEHLRGQQFEVSAINSYEYERNTITEWVLTGNNDIELYLSLEVDDKSYLKFALKVQHEDIESLFDLDEFSTVFDEPGQAFLDKKSDTPLTSGWTSPQYQQSTFCQVGYFHRKDHRSEQISAYEGKDAGEQFELYTLLDEDQQKGIDIEVWQDGDTDVFLTMYRPMTDIIDLFPGS